MLFQFGLYSSLLLITFSQGIIYSFLLFKKGLKSNNTSNYWLSLFVFLCTIFIAPWMLGFAGWYDKQPYRDFMFYIPFQHLFLIGPVLYFYIQSVLNPSFRFSKKEALHFIPGILYLVYIFGMFIYDKFIFEKPYFYANGMDKDFDNWYQYSGFISMVIYLVLSLKYYSNYKKIVVQVTSNADSVLFNWINKFLLAFLGMILLKVIAEIFFAIFPEYTDYVGTWWFYLLFSIILYYIAITGYTNAVETKIGFEMSVFNSKPILLLDNFQNENLDTIDIQFEDLKTENSFEIENWKIKIENLILKDKLYQNPELTLSQVSKLLESNTSIISKVINQGFSMNFNDFINNYRIESVKKMFQKGEHKKSTLIGIAYDCGFNSKATFNRAFKKNTGFTPKDFIKNL